MSIALSTVLAVTLTGRDPGTEMVAGEVAEYRYDAVNDLGPGQSVLTPTVALIDTRTGLVIVGGATLDTVPLEGSVIVMRVAGVERHGLYELRIGFDHEPPRVAGEHSVKLHAIEGF